MLYDLSLRMGFVYDTPASGARHIVRVLPLTLPGRQRLIAGTVTVSPAPEEKTTFIDFFRHGATAVTVRAPHEKLDIHMQARVQVDSLPVTADLSPVLDALAAETAGHLSVDPGSPHHFMGSSPRIPSDPALAAYARELSGPNLTVRQIAVALCERINAEFVYDPKATTVDTRPREAFDLKRGVCQDFSHVMITALRSLGVPAGYVSGFLRTTPPPGEDRLEGADAMHAWVRVWCGKASGWIELDPTNNMVAGADHIVVAYGRDYADVAPVIGVVKSYGSHKTSQAVDVVPVQLATTATRR